MLDTILYIIKRMLKDKITYVFFVLMFYVSSNFRYGSKIAEQSAASKLRMVPTRPEPPRNKLKVHQHNKPLPHAAALQLHSRTQVHHLVNRVPAHPPLSLHYLPGPESTVHLHRIVFSCQARRAACKK